MMAASPAAADLLRWAGGGCLHVHMTLWSHKCSGSERYPFAPPTYSQPAPNMQAALTPVAAVSHPGAGRRAAAPSRTAAIAAVRQRAGRVVAAATTEVGALATHAFATTRTAGRHATSSQTPIAAPLGCAQAPAAAAGVPPPVQPAVLPGTPASGAAFPFTAEQLIEKAKQVRGSRLGCWW